MKPSDIKILLKRALDPNFRKGRNEFIEHRRGYYQVIDGLYREGLIDKAHEREAELAEKERHFGLRRDYSLYDSVGIVKVDLSKFLRK